mmetsp:Transcript_14489/g.12756  ORF Transcript_14489/g.12756 Transcript_14489/m.12756 type:complete len:206 (+) Transcript_14489:433-1050(+)
MPSIDRNNSANYLNGEPSISREKEYRNKPHKNRRYLSTDQDNDSMITLSRSKGGLKNEKASMSQSIRQTVVGSFRPNDPNSIMKSIQVQKPMNDHYSEYDLYNSYGSSNGFTAEKKLSNKMMTKIKASFKYRDEVETAETDSFFSSKFSRFNVPNKGNNQPISHPTNSTMPEIRKKAVDGGSKQSNFPSISKCMPDYNNGSLPSI